MTEKQRKQRLLQKKLSKNSKMSVKKLKRLWPLLQVSAICTAGCTIICRIKHAADVQLVRLQGIQVVVAAAAVVG
jgi:hypothetical protein